MAILKLSLDPAVLNSLDEDTATMPIAVQTKSRETRERDFRITDVRRKERFNNTDNVRRVNRTNNRQFIKFGENTTSITVEYF